MRMGVIWDRGVGGEHVVSEGLKRRVTSDSDNLLLILLGSADSDLFSHFKCL